MRKIIIYFICHLFYFSNAQTFEWVNTVGGFDYDGSTSLISDSLGNAYVVGTFRKTIDIDPGIGTLNFISSNDTSLFIQKLNSDGKLIWAHQIDYAWAHQIEFDKQGNILILGSFRGNVDIDPSIGVFNLIGQNNTNLFLLKLDSSGNFIWATVAMKNCLDCYAADLNIDKDNNILLTGSFRGSVDIDPGSSTFTLSSFNTNYPDAFVAKYNNIGNLVWGKVFRGREGEYGQAIVSDILGNVYVAGSFYISTDLDPGPGNFIMTSMVGYADAFIVKLNSNGNFIWAKEYNNSSNGFIFIYDMRLDKNQNLITVGVFDNKVDFDLGPNTNIINSTSTADFYVMQLDINANFKWVKTFNSTSYDRADIIYIDKNNDYFISGLFRGNIDVISNKPLLQSRGNFDVFIVKMDDVGNPIYAKSMGGNGYDYLSSLSVSNGSLYVTGYYPETAYFDCHTITSNGFSDSYTAKISDCEADYTVDSIKACDTYTWIDGIVYTESIDSILFYTLNKQCCDSIVELNLTLHNSDNEFINIIANDEYEWNDSIYNTTGNYVKVYTNRNGCDSTIHVNLFIIQDEICNNSIDDDNDGYVDGFDSDCPCKDGAYQAHCSSNCEIIPDSFPDIKMKMKWESESIGLSVYGNICLGRKDNNMRIFTKTNINAGHPIGVKNFITSFDGKNGNIIDQFQLTEFQIWNETHISISIGDVVGNGDIYIYTELMNDSLFCFNEDGDILWKQWSGINGTLFVPSLADINSDGIPEIYMGSTVFNSQTGDCLYRDGSIAGCNSLSDTPVFGFGNCDFGVSIAADFTDAPGLEIAAGNKVYEIEITNINGRIGNKANIIEANSVILSGITAAADINNDNALDVVVVRNKNFSDGGGIWIWDPRTKELIAGSTSNTDGGMPFIGDVDGDCIPEIGMTFKNELRMYKYDGTKILKLLWQIPTSDNSGHTGVSMFDFNQDGKQELVYRDETSLKIFAGASGATIDSFPMFSKTAGEYPIIADVDNDGQAEIIVSGSRSSLGEVHMYCFESATTPWAPARSVWNQYAYNPTQVNDDLTIPRYQQNAAQPLQGTENCPRETCNTPYNNFMAQATYRTQAGCEVWPTSDVSLNVMRYVCNTDSLIFYLVVGNEGDKNITEDTMDLSIYATIPDMTASPLERRKIYLSRDADGKVSRSDTIRLAIVMPNTDIKSLLFRINDGGFGDAYSAIHGLSPTLECDYENNSALIAIDISTQTLDLGPDILKCRTKVITLDAGSGFVSYLWNDLSEDTLFSTSEAGVYSIIATDQCGRYYQDTVTFTIDESLKPNLGPDILLCEGDTTTISVGSEFTWVQWYPEEMVSCDTCFSTLVTADTTFDLVLISNKSGCIDADTITVDIKALPRSEKQTSICAGTSIDFYGQKIDAAGRYEHRLGQCDSLIILDVTLLRRDSTILSQDICVGDSILVFDTWYDSPTETTLTGKNVYGCDSIVQVSLRVVDTLTSVQSLSFCEGDSIFVQDRWIDKAGTYDYAFTSTRGCDSIATYELVKIPTSSSTSNFSICQGDSIFVADQWYYNAGSYEAVRTNAQGCDSIITIEIFTLPTSSDMRTLSICIGDSIKIHNTWQYQSGTYTESFKNNNGCDSTSIVTLGVSPYLLENDSLSICEGDTIMVNGQMVYTAGLYVDTLSVDGSCQKIMTTQVSLIDRAEESMILTLCPDSIATIGNLVIDESGTFTLDLISQSGCDSTLTILANKLTWPQPPIITINCKDEQYTATWAPQSPWNIEWGDGSTDTIYKQDEGGMLTARSYATGCEKVYEYELPPLPKLSDIPQLRDQLVKSSASLPLSVDLDETSWTIMWSPADLFSCTTCFDTKVTTNTDTTITVSMTHESGCSFEQQFLIIRDVSSVISIPNIFNPASTSGNNLWTVTVPSGSLVAEVRIYDRWGNQVFISKNENQITWDGNYQGKALTPGVYVYHVKVVDGDGKISMLYGDVTLVR